MEDLDRPSLRHGFAGSKADDDARRRHSALPAGRDVEGHVPGMEEDMQQLMTEEFAKTVPRLYGQDGADDPIVHVHYFSCVNGWDWYLTEYDPRTGEAFGLVRGFETEWGYFSVREMERVNREKGFGVVERDEHFEPTPASRFEGR